MIERDKIYIINTNDLTQVKCFSVGETVSYKIAMYLLGKRIPLFLLCRPGYSSIFLESHLHCEMVEEIKKWLTATIKVRYRGVGKMKSIPFPFRDKEKE
ncbi:hypothetical protein LCGC14_0221110 [marine sediment metagenome]|uniref:Uncharacterized protein n=1 Tax=marine sediment metagenome TaxID=412755 RepID=A0A0F9XH49_9ZZZZ